MNKPSQRRIIGLTGGIGTGKTTVSNYLQNDHKLPIFDADIYAREAVQIGSPVFKEIVQRYGQKILLSDGSLNRKQLGDIIFNNLQEKQWLEGRIHPYVRHCFQVQLQSTSDATVVFVIPLLFEAKLTHLVTEIWVVSCSAEQQLQRLQIRNNLTIEQAQARIKSQIPLQEKVDAADVVLQNRSTLEILLEQIDNALLLDR